jgi:hypothetical protein
MFEFSTDPTTTPPRCPERRSLPLVGQEPLFEILPRCVDPTWLARSLSSWLDEAVRGSSGCDAGGNRTHVPLLYMIQVQQRRLINLSVFG